VTINELQQQLIDEIVHITSEMSMTGKDGELKELRGYRQAIPVFTAYSDDLEGGGDNLFPYFVVRADSITYHSEDDGNTARIMIMFAIYDEDPGQRGYYTLTSIMERVVLRFQKDPVLGPFYCSEKMALQYQEDDSYPQFFGGIEMIWHMPDISREET